MSTHTGFLKRLKADWQQTAESLMHDRTAHPNPADIWLTDDVQPLLPHPRRPDHDTHLRRAPAKRKTAKVNRVSRSHLTDSLHKRHSHASA